MQKIILYGSRYGTAKEYAEELSRRTGIKALPYKQAGALAQYDTLIYFGGLYAGGVLGLAKTLKRLPSQSSPRLIIATVGLANPQDDRNINHIRNGLRQQIPRDRYEKARLFHLRGGIDYANLSLLHRMMMRFVYQRAKSLPPEEQTPESRELVETYQTRVDFIDFTALDDLIALLNHLAH